MFKKRGKPAPLLTLNDLHVIFTLAMLGVAIVVMVIEMLADGTYHCPGVTAIIPKAYNAVALRRAVSFDAMTITIFRDGKVYFGRDFATPDKLPDVIRKSVSEAAERKVYLRVDGNAKYGNVSRVLAEVRSVGIENVAFLVEKRTPVDAAAFAP